MLHAYNIQNVEENLPFSSMHVWCVAYINNGEKFDESKPALPKLSKTVPHIHVNFTG